MALATVGQQANDNAISLLMGYKGQRQQIFAETIAVMAEIVNRATGFEYL